MTDESPDELAYRRRLSAMRRRFTAPPIDLRCMWDITLRADKSGAQCMRKRVVGNYCAQHAKMAKLLTE